MLRRTAVGTFSVDHAAPGDVLREGRCPDSSHWVEAAAAVGHLTTVRVEADAALLLRQGGAIAWSEEAGPGEPIAVMDEGGLVGIAEIRNGHLAPKKILTVPANR